MKHSYLLIAALPSSATLYWTYMKSPQKNFLQADCTTSYVLNSRVTEPNLTIFLQDVQKWLPITLLKSKLWSSNPFRNDNVTNENSRRIVVKIVHFNSLNSDIISISDSLYNFGTIQIYLYVCIIGQKFIKFGHNVVRLLPLNLLKADLRLADPLSSAEAKSNDRSMRHLWTSPKFYWLP